jgi:hypothetical protein
MAKWALVGMLDAAIAVSPPLRTDDAHWALLEGKRLLPILRHAATDLRPRRRWQQRSRRRPFRRFRTPTEARIRASDFFSRFFALERTNRGDRI